MVGGGVVAMPVAFLNTGLLVGLSFMLVICVFFAYTAHLLGENWVIMQERWPQYRELCRKPYPEIALRSMGPRMKVAASIIVYVTLFGTAVVYILLSSRIIQHLIASVFGAQIGFCYLLCVVSVAIMPLTYLKSPADFWLVIVVAMLCTICAVALIILGVSFDMSACLSEVHYPPCRVSSAILSLGTFLFAFSGHHAFPTIQHDMKRPIEFSKSVVLGFIMVALLYMPLSVYGYVVYGDSMQSSVIDSVQTSWIRYAADLSIAVHCILTLIIMANPLNQQAEDLLNASHAFGVERVMIRSCVLAAMLFCALTIPDFGPFMNLVGSTTIPVVCAALPSICNLYLNASVFDQKAQKYTVPSLHDVFIRTNKVKLALNIFIISVALIAGVVSAYLAIEEITLVHFTPPCYLRPLLSAGGSYFNGELINCCGINRNIVAFGNATNLCRP
ncbi:Lysine histidine transporter 1 [Toxocara canis]|uniref:Lysine histidine transporter 1 n=1 Tax=Toxocara canis TaxID=6265 RepID=A0A0B2V9H0_TOXCA|nr:Lysine histidine transporter 1 [Toxocara canis]